MGRGERAGASRQALSATIAAHTDAKDTLDPERNIASTLTWAVRAIHRVVKVAGSRYVPDT